MLARARQYDIELLFAAPLQSLGLTSLAAALSRCASLTLLDVSRNCLRSLEGLAHGASGAYCPQLVFLNAAENQLIDVSTVASLPRLERVWLEGNELNGKAALAPLVNLPALTELRLRRSIMVDGAPLVLGNPVCANAAVYSSLASEMFPAVRWLDDKVFRRDAEPPTADRIAAAEQLNSEISDAAAKLAEASAEVQDTALSEERELQKLLAV